MRATEQQLLIVRANESERRATHTLIMVSIGGVIDVVLLSVVFVLVDRTHERTREASRALAYARDAALQVAETKSSFLANMSHEIRTPMNAIIGMTSLLLNTKLDRDQRELAETASTSADALLGIINDILDFSKLEAGKLVIERHDFDLRATVESTVEALSTAAQAKGLDIGVLLDSTIPPVVTGDAGRIRQVLTNLTANAIKFTREGAVIVHLTVDEESDERVRIRFSVTDTGIGIAGDVVGTLFKPFAQADASTTRQFGGTGLGLAISKELVERMGGEIAVESSPGQGSTFSFTLPFEKASGALRTAATAREVLIDVNALVVDDSATNRRIIRHNLDSWRMRSSEAANAVEAMELLQERSKSGDPFDIAIVDMVMPDVDGLELARRIRHNAEVAGTRTIILTSMGSRLEQPVLDSAGISACLTKPVRQSALFDAIAEALADDGSAKRVEQLKPAPDLRLRGNARVLVAEDNVVNQRVAVRQLERFGMKAETVSNGAEAVEALAIHDYDLVLMDVQMPEMDGFEATGEVRRREGTARHTPIVAMTANALVGDRERCLRAGMDDYISKPVMEDDLSRILHRWLHDGTTLDPEFVASLRTLDNGSGTFLAEIATLFLSDAPVRVDAIRNAIENGDMQTVNDQAHALKSSAGNVGATELSDRCGELELMAKRGVVSAEMLPDFIAAYLRAAEAMRELAV
jgi:two-component system, sensor histidine kinase and response regulator